MICPVETEGCYTGECSQCPTTQLQDILTERLEIDLNGECSWTIWKKMNNKFDLQKVTGSLDSLLNEIVNQWSNYLLHTYCNRQQREYIAYLRTQSTD